MSNAQPKTVEHKIEKYKKQTGREELTPAQDHQAKKTIVRLNHTQQRSVHREMKRNARQRFREWMAGLRG